MGPQRRSRSETNPRCRATSVLNERQRCVLCTAGLSQPLTRDNCPHPFLLLFDLAVRSAFNFLSLSCFLTVASALSDLGCLPHHEWRWNQPLRLLICGYPLYLCSDMISCVESAVYLSLCPTFMYMASQFWSTFTALLDSFKAYLGVLHGNITDIFPVVRSRSTTLSCV